MLLLIYSRLNTMRCTCCVLNRRTYNLFSCMLPFYDNRVARWTWGRTVIGVSHVIQKKQLWCFVSAYWATSLIGFWLEWDALPKTMLCVDVVSEKQECTFSRCTGMSNWISHLEHLMWTLLLSSFFHGCSPSTLKDYSSNILFTKSYAITEWFLKYGRKWQLFQWLA